MPKRYIRQSSIINIEDFEDNTISIVGCGAIGSYVATSLAKMGLKNFKLWDYDKVEEHNLPNQFFRESDIGTEKAVATHNSMIEFNKDCNIQIQSKYEGGEFASQIVICCVDTMEARKLVFRHCMNDEKVQLFIDTRMGGLQGQIYFIDINNKKEVEYYKSTLFSDEEAVKERCTERSILFTVLGISSIVCQQIVKALNGEEIKNYIVFDFIVPQLVV